jgi:hypothetical protein
MGRRNIGTLSTVENPAHDFAVRRVAVDFLPDEEIYVVALSEYLDGEGRSLVIQRATSFDEQERRLGLDSYSLSDELGATMFGAIDRCILSGNSLTLGLRPEAAETFVTSNGELRLQLLVDPNEVSLLAKGLRHVLTNSKGQPEVMILN